MSIEPEIPRIKGLIDSFVSALNMQDPFGADECIRAMIPDLLNVYHASFMGLDFEMDMLLNATIVHDMLYRAHLGGGRAADLFHGSTGLADLHYVKRGLFHLAAVEHCKKYNDVLVSTEKIGLALRDNDDLVSRSVAWISRLASNAKTSQHVRAAIAAIEGDERAYLNEALDELMATMDRVGDAGEEPKRRSLWSRIRGDQ